MNGNFTKPPDYYPLRQFACYNDIHNQNLNIHTVNYIHVRELHVRE